MKFEQVDDNPAAPGIRFVDLDKVTGVSVHVQRPQGIAQDITEVLMPVQERKRIGLPQAKVIVTLSFGTCMDTKTFDDREMADSWLAENFSLGNVVYF
jgi:hypothetical protein